MSVAIGVATITSFDGSTQYAARWTLLVAGWLWVATSSSRHNSSRMVFVIPGLLLAFAALGSVRSERLVAATAILSNLGFATAVFWTSSQALRTRVAATLDGILAAAVFHALWALGEALTGAERSSGGFFNPNHAGAWFAWAAVYGALRGGPVGTGLCVVFGAGIVATGSRSALLALIGAVLVILFARAKWWAVALCVASPLAVVTISPLRNRFLGVGDAFAFDRLTIWRAAWRAGIRQPWGWGIGDAPVALRQTGVSVLHGPVQFPKVAKHAHNELLQLWIELGVMTFIVACLGLLLAAALVHFTRPGERVWMIAGITAIAIPAMLGETLRTPVLATSG
ncbi:MAG: O-antigen ligase family protein, partial [Myxococcota bacterium]